MRSVEVGQSIGERQLVLTRDSLVRYAGASGDYNPIHYLDAFALDVGLPGVIAHGMLLMGQAIQLVVDWLGDPAGVVDYTVRFGRWVPVPHPGEATLTVSGAIVGVDQAAGQARLTLKVTQDGAKVLGKVNVVVRLDGQDPAEPAQATRP
ncbi:MAG: dehydratase [Bifidobacteriaceae bacterium]|jgi:acyl dehydratase|nr:dehydratase [Bifidobacteriaceae bacterium]